MGRGDKKTKRGKIAIGSFGNIRPRTANKVSAPAPVAETADATPAAKPKRARAKKSEE